MSTNTNLQYGSLTVMHHIFYILLQPQTYQISPTTEKNTDEGPFLPVCGAQLHYFLLCHKFWHDLNRNNAPSWLTDTVCQKN